VDGYNLALALWQTAPAEAQAHLQWSADRGLAEAAHLLGNLALDNGDSGSGIAQLESAALAGLALAQFDLATALLERNASGDRTEAVRWYGRAAAGGENAARYNLAVLLLGGRLGDTRPLLAWAWLSSLDPIDSHAEVLRLASELAGQMNEAERARAAVLLRDVRDDPVAAAAQLALELEPPAQQTREGDAPVADAGAG
jgi:TPR repeat protein